MEPNRRRSGPVAVREGDGACGGIANGHAFPEQPLLLGPFNSIVRDPDAPVPTPEVIGKTSAFKTSTGIEVRFFMPVLNVPFRLIYAWNPQRGGVLNNDLRPANPSTFKFSVGTTF